MKFQYYLQEPKFRVGGIDIQSVSRPKNYKHFFKNGREHHGFIYIVSGSMLQSFQNCDIKELRAERGDLIFVPKGCVYGLVGPNGAGKRKTPGSKLYNLN